MYPPQLPDLFHGGQLVVLGRYNQHGPTAVKLTGVVGGEPKEYVYELPFAEKTNDDRVFVEHVWARRKVGYLLDQIRANGEKKELVDEVTGLAKKYGIATPYTSYLIVPDGPVPVAGRGEGRGGRPNVGFGPGGGTGTPGVVPGSGFGGGFGGAAPPALRTPQPADPRSGAAATAPAPAPKTVTEFAKEAKGGQGQLGKKRDEFESFRFKALGKDKDKGHADEALQPLAESRDRKNVLDQAREALARRNLEQVQTGKAGVDLSVHSLNLRGQTRLEQTAVRTVAGRNCLEIGGVWIDEGFDAKMPTLAVKAQSDAYFRLLEKHPQLKEVFRLGNFLVWVTPNGTALIVDRNDGKEKLTDAEIDALFLAKK